MVGVLGVDFSVFVALFPGSPSLPPLTLVPNLVGVGLGAYRGPPIVLWESFGAPIEGRPKGVKLTFWVFRNGDSGRGNDGLDLALTGLGARPGPTD